MRRSILVCTAAVIALTACNGATKPNAAAFATAINHYLTSHGQLCISASSALPVDIPISEQRSPHGIGEKLVALQQAGLLNETETSAVVPSLANSLSLAPHKAEQVRRYALSREGQKYLQTTMTDFGRAPSFCYGLKQVDSILKWTEPVTVGPSIESQVTYRYKVIDLAPWASRPDIQQQFPIITTMLGAASKTDQLIGVQLTNSGWDVNTH